MPDYGIIKKEYIRERAGNMKDIRVVVADDSDITRNLIIGFLSDEGDIQLVAAVKDGEEAISAIKETHPDMVILDLVMPKVDGIGVMEAIAQCDGEKPKYIVISSVGSEDIVGEAIRMGASYFIMKPFNGETLVKRIKQIAARRDVVSLQTARTLYADNQSALYAPIEKLLRKLGVSVRMTGYKYIRDAIIFAIKNPDSLASITKSIYPEIAESYQTSSGNVERNIRYVIDVTWSGRNDSKYSAAFAEVFGDDGARPTNSKFILSCCDWINSLVQE